MRRRRQQFSRRQFLVQSASLAAGLGVTRASRGEKSGGEVDSREAGLGFIGLGDRGRDLLGTVLADREARVVGLCDPDPQNLKRAMDMAREQRPRGFTNYRALLDSREIDAVFIATPVYLHHSHTLTALAAGKHVYCEKPMAVTPEECSEVLHACGEAEGNGQIYQIGLQRRYSPRYQASLAFLQSGGAGRVLFVRAQWHAVGSARKSKPWLFQRDKSGDIVLEQACHQFDVFNWVFGATPISVCGQGGCHGVVEGPPRRDTLDHYGLVLEFPGGGKVHHSHVTYSIPERRFAGIYELAFCEKTGVDLANAVTWGPSGQTRELCKERGNDTRLAVAGFLRSLLDGEPAEASAQVGYNATLAALLSRKALECDRRVRWDEILPG